jgi:hypothetical protein
LVVLGRCTVTRCPSSRIQPQKSEIGASDSPDSELLLLVDEDELLLDRVARELEDDDELLDEPDDEDRPAELLELLLLALDEEALDELDDELLLSELLLSELLDDELLSEELLADELLNEEDELLLELVLLDEELDNAVLDELDDELLLLDVPPVSSRFSTE